MNPNQQIQQALQTLTDIYHQMFDTGVTDPKAYEALRLVRANLILKSLNHGE